MKKLIVLAYSIFLFLLAIFSYVFIDSNLPYLKNFYFGFAFSNRLLTTVFYTLSIFVFFIFYGAFIYLGVKRKIGLRDICVIIIITAAVLFFSYPAMLSYDIFNYVATSKVLFFYHENPYVIMPIDFTGDPFLSFMHAANKIALYGPIWIILTGIPYFFGAGNFIITLFSFKLLISFFYLATIFLLWKMSKNIISVMLFSINPLIVIETLISGHNDIAMIFFVMLSFFLLMKKKVFFAILLFIFSILMKYTTILLIPIFLYILWKNFRKKETNWENIFYFSSLLMFAGFLFSPIREEIYPWYAIWFLSFSFLLSHKKILLYISTAFSFGLLFRYTPFMFFGTHAGLTPLIKSAVTFLPPFLVGLYLIIKKKIWGNFYR